MNTKELKRVNEYLSVIDRKKIADKFNVTEGYVRLILRGCRRNDDIVHECVDVALRNKKRIKTKSDKLSQKLALI